jgi:6-phosphogluconolactonase (cycloisomerase 2 family)
MCDISVNIVRYIHVVNVDLKCPVGSQSAQEALHGRITILTIKEEPMNKLKVLLGIFSVFMLLILSSCEKQNEVVSPLDEENQDFLNDSEVISETSFLKKFGNRGAVFTMSNSAAGNEVLVFERSSDGTLSQQGSYSTGGLGTGSGLGNQGGVILSKGRGLLLVCNAGSNDISVFRIKRGGLNFLDRVPSGGEMPISLTSHGRLVYALNAGGNGNISAFVIRGNGHLKSIPGSTRPLSGNGTGPAQISFSNSGRILAVTEKATNQILTYRVHKHGQSSGPEVHSSSGSTPFGFAFSPRGYLVVSEAFGGAPNASATSSYRVFNNGSLNVISPSVSSGQTAACWIVITGNGKFAYATNTGSGNITGYRIRHNGSIHLLNQDGITGVTGPGSSPIDMAISRANHYLYSLNSGTQNFSIFRINRNGSLEHIEETGSLPPGANGLVAF